MFARFILRTELATTQTKIEALDFYLNQERTINKDLREHFINKTIPIDLIKTLEEKQIYIGDLKMLKNTYNRIKEQHKVQLKQYNEIFIPEFDKALCDDVDTRITAQQVNAYNKMVLTKLESECIALESIISKLEGII